jgi:tetratricopeptide (TPR) repeat protein
MILNYDHYRTGKRKRGRRTALITSGAAAVLVLVVLALVLKLPSRLFDPGVMRQAPGKLPDLWKADNYEGVIAASDSLLRGDPLNATALSYRGFAYFYRAAAENALEEKLPFLDESIVSLRRALLAGTSFTGEADYVLGKAYFYKGKYYYDESISFMEASIAKGYVQKDSNEYVGLAYTQLGDYDKGMEYFLMALKEDSGDLLLLTIGQTYYQMKRTADAIDYLLRTLNKTDDKAIEKRARFLLGEIYLDRNELFKAEEQYTAIVKIDPQSADAHFFLGEVYSKMNDPVRARSEWRNALIIDPSHYGAKLRYYPARR